MSKNLAFLDSITLEELEADPYPIWERLRKEAPVAFVPAIGAWCVTTYDDCAKVGSGSLGFEGAKDHPTLSRVFGIPNVLSAEGETHSQIRAGVGPRLQPKQVNELMETTVRPIARRYIATIAGRGQGELMSEYFEPVSVEALRHVMGLDDLVNADTLRRWFHDLNAGTANFGLDEQIFATSDRAGREIERIIRPKLEFLVRQPDDSMLSHMLWAGRKPEEGHRPFDLIWPSLKVILLGGMQEPGHAAASTLLGLFSQPRQWDKLVKNPDTWIPYAINEGLRWIAPIGVVERQATRDVQLGGHTIKAHSIVQIILASANRDESRYKNPDVFDMERTGETHQAFGNGGHFCAGHFFARQVERIMLEELVTQLPKLRKRPGVSPKIEGWVFRAPKVFQCKWEPVDVAALAPAQEAEKPLFQPSCPSETLILQVKAMTLEAENILSIELAHPDNRPLPGWEPGAHADIWLSNERAGQYSLCGDPARLDSWTIAVNREPKSRGISSYIHEKLRPGNFVAVGFPRNHFPLGDAPGYCFIAGGIGITPLLPMMEAVSSRGIPMSVTYCGRRRSTMAFADRVEKLAGPQSLAFSEVSGRSDLSATVRTAASAGHAIFVCGSAGIIAEVEAHASRSGAVVYSERFEGVEALRKDDFGFTIELAKSGKTYFVPPEKTILQVLEENGYSVRKSCLEGNCGTCETKVMSGLIQHRDILLTPHQREAMDRMMICVSRAQDADQCLCLDL